MLGLGSPRQMTPLWIAIPIFVLGLGAVGLLVYWCIAWVRLMRNFRLPTARAGVDLARADPPTGTVCVVVPAHNEAGMIGKLVASLRAQSYPGLRVVLALDRCTDGTEDEARRAIAGDARFEIVRVSECPERWAGKVNAAWQGVQRSDGAQTADYLLFSDADCRFEPGAIEAAVALLEARELDLLSLFCTLDARSWFERVAQPAAGFELGRQYPMDRANEVDRSRRRPFANGQFMLFRAGAYREVGGHERVHVHLLEDIEFARAMTAIGKRTGMLLADGLVRCRMYETWGEFRRGWKRIYTEAANRKAGRLRQQAWRMRVGAVALPVCAVGCLGLSLAVPVADQPLKMAAMLVPEAALALWAAGLAAVYASGGFPVWAAPLHPVGAWLVSRVMLDAARDLDEGTPTEWGGKSYARTLRG